MTGGELAVLSHAHQLFAGNPRPVTLEAGTAGYDAVLARAAELNTGGGQDRYRLAVADSRAALQSSGRTDAVITGVLARAHQDHATVRALTKHLVDEARADAASVADTPLAQRELLRRRVARLRAQRAHLLWARQRARRHRAALRGLHYRVLHRHGTGLHGVRLPPANSRAGIAVRAALSRLGRPYVWGAAGPHQFDCSGLTQWAYRQAGLHLDRTTYQQIHQGIAVPRGQVRPGDLVFPNAGHVQLAIGHNLVVEAPHAGASVRISPLGAHVQIRRPV
ncbi:C40 family peptidase [Mycobacterium sp. pUA109]|uniref:C40 family peptidase n=1 Tax=Mycobacterium sp. pUA109 TaxID=3238982 RepID=UPI00351B6106